MSKKRIVIWGKKGRILTAVAAAAVAAFSAWAATGGLETFRTLAYGVGIYQTHDAAGKPAYGTQGFAGHDLVAAALGLPLGTTLTNQVLALQVDCGSTTASLVAFDKASSNIVAVLATSTSLQVVQQQDKDSSIFPNRERFVAQLAITPTNNLLGGFLTVAGRLQLDPATGCPRALRIDRDKLDRYCADVDGLNDDDKKDHDILRAGIGHAVGSVDLVFNDGSHNTVLLPFVSLSIRRQLQ